ncbi:hypothetical protein D3C86_1317150 [compost metagenome]
MIFKEPKTLMSKLLLASSSVNSSKVPICPKPALLTITSSFPKCAILVAIAFFTSSLSDKFTSIGKNKSDTSPSSWIKACLFREVAITLNPSFNNFFTSDKPKPFEAPVTNHTFFVFIVLIFMIIQM